MLVKYTAFFDVSFPTEIKFCNIILKAISSIPIIGLLQKGGWQKINMLNASFVFQFISIIQLITI